MSAVCGSYGQVGIRNFFQNGEAQCNDGTPAGYYIQLSEQGSNSWILFLEGGGLCYDRTSCLSRPSQLVSSKLWPSKMSFAGLGLLSNNVAQNPDFYDFNHVFVMYCTSDLYTGNATFNSFGFQFQGSKIVASLIDDLTNPNVTPYPNLQNATDILFSGGSAGGVGTFMNAEYVSQRITWATVKAAPDAGWFIDAPQYDMNIPLIFDMVIAGAALWNSKGWLNQDCVNQHSSNTSLCLLAEYVYPFLDIPIFIQKAQTDAWTVANVGIKKPYSQSEIQYMKNLASLVRESFVEASVNTVFSPMCVIHTTFLGKLFQQVTIQGVSLQQALGDWYFERKSSIDLIDSCREINCNLSCGTSL